MSGLLHACVCATAMVCDRLPSPQQMTADRAEKLLSIVFTRWHQCEWSALCVCATAIVCDRLPSPLQMTADRAEKLLSIVFTRWRRCEWSAVCVHYSDGV